MKSRKTIEKSMKSRKNIEKSMKSRKNIEKSLKKAMEKGTWPIVPYGASKEGLDSRLLASTVDRGMNRTLPKYAYFALRWHDVTT